MHLNLSFMGNCEVTDSTGIHHGWPLTITPKHPSPAARHSTWKCRCKVHQTCFVRSSSVVSPILLQVQNMLAHGWGHHLWQETHPLLQWEDEALHTAWGRQWPRCRGSLTAGAAFCTEPAPGQQVPAGSSGLCHQLSLWGNPLPILYECNPVLMSQTFSSQGSFVFPPSYTRLFSCLCGHLPCRSESWVVFVTGASWNHSTTGGFTPALSTMLVLQDKAWHFPVNNFDCNLTIN